jgi:hypothetical protein
MLMRVWQAVLYILAVILIAAAAFGVGGRVSLALLGAACFVLAFALPTIAAP